MVYVRYYEGDLDGTTGSYANREAALRAIHMAAGRENGSVGIIVRSDDTQPATPTVSQDEIQEHLHAEYEDERAQHEDDMSAGDMRAQPEWDL